MNSDILPSAKVLINESLAYIRERSDLVVLLSLPLIVFTVSDYFFKSETIESNLQIFVLVSVINIIALIFHLLIAGSSLYAVTKSPERRVGFKEAMSWAKANVLKIVWIYLLTMLVVMGGLLLFVIPGLILSLYTYFAQYVYINEGLRGMEALRRSHDLVKDNWLDVAGKLLKVILIIMLIFIVIGMIIGLIQKLTLENSAATLFFLLVMQVLSAALTLAGFKIGNDLYLSLIKIKGEQIETKPPVAKWKYATLAVLGLVSIVVFSSLMAWAVSLEIEKEQGSLPTNIEFDPKARLIELREQKE